MCLNSSEKTHIYSFCLQRLSKRKTIRLRLRGLNRMRKLGGEEADCKRKREIEIERKVKMEMKNLKLYMENQSIMEENQKLRNKAILLHQENKALLSQLQQKNALS